jgi:ADP-ribose pyrophosphatase
MREETLKSKRIYKGRLLGLRDDTVKMSTGKVSSREVCEHPGAVAIVAVTKKKEIVLIRQFRLPAKRVLMEIPAGLIDKGEDLQAAAKRELEEETGYLAKKVTPVFEAFTTPGYSTEVLSFYLATDLEKKKQHYEEDENIETCVLKIDEAWQLVEAAEIEDNKTIIGIMIAKWMI